MLLLSVETASAESLELPLPGGESMRFQAIRLGAGKELSGGRDFMMGNRDPQSGNVMERLVPSRIGGSFLISGQSGELDWCYYLGQTEVTSGQWAVVMGEPTPPTPTLPKTGISYHDVQQFLSRLNQWLRRDAQARGRLPRNEGQLGFLRLPTEAEWEFACRGGTKVDEDTFNSQRPHFDEREIMRREWVFGSDASTGKLKPVKSTGQPNVLGLYDMLGNAAEMTESLFSLDYFTGRMGGYVVRGGSVNTLPSQVRSSLRSEQHFYLQDGTPFSSGHHGFRIVIGCEIIWNTAIVERLAKEEASRPSTDRLPRIDPARSGGGTADETSHQLAQAGERIRSLEQQVKKISESARQPKREGSGTTPDAARSREQEAQLLAQISLLRTNLETAEAIVYERDRRIAATSVRFLSWVGRQMVINSNKIAWYEELRKDEQSNGKLISEFQSEYSVWRGNQGRSWESYKELIEGMADINPQIRRAAFDAHREELIVTGPRERLNALSDIEAQTREFREGVSMKIDTIVERLKISEEGR